MRYPVKSENNFKRIVALAVTMVLIMSFSFQVYAEAIYYVVKTGDSLSNIANQFGVDVDALAAANGIKDKNIIFPGQKLLISESPPEKGVKTELSEEEGKDDQETTTYEFLSEYLLSEEDDSPEISIAMLNASVRDILSSIALYVNEYIFYIGQDDTSTFVVENVKPKKALDMFLKTVQPSGQKLSYIRDGNIIIIGPIDMLKKNFFNEITLKDFKLKYIPAEVLSTQIAALGLELTNIFLSSTPNHLFVQGTPQELAKVAELITILDKKEYFPDEVVNETRIYLRQYELRYITADMLRNIVSGLGIQLDMITVPNNPKTVWVNGDSNAISNFLEVKNKMDIEKNAPPEGGLDDSEYVLYHYSFQHIVYEDIADIVSGLLPEVTVFPLDFYPSVVLVHAKPDAFKSFLELVDGLDQRYLADKTKYYHHRLNNITAQEAAARIESMAIENLNVYTMNLAKFSKDLLVVCPEYMQDEVRELINGLDVKGTAIRVPVDYSTVIDGQQKLEARREILVKLTGLLKEQFYISGNIARGDSFHYIMYVEGTPEEIQLVSDMIAKMDNP
jgi:LysM repeat protein